MQNPNIRLAEIKHRSEEILSTLSCNKKQMGTLSPAIAKEAITGQGEKETLLKHDDDERIQEKGIVKW